MGLGSFFKGIVQGAVNISGKVLRGGATAAGAVGRLSGKVAGGAVELAGEVAGSVVGLASDRLGDAVKSGTKAAARIVETPSEIITRTGEQIVYKLTGAASTLVGDEEGADDALDAEIENGFKLCEHLDSLRGNTQQAVENLVAKNIFDKTKRKYDELRNKQDAEQTRVDEEINKYNNLINQCLSDINNYRGKANELFRQFEILSAAFADWQVRNRVFVENFTPRKYTLDKMPSSIEIFANVNFDENPIWTNLKGLISLGFWNEVQLKEVEEKLSKMETEVLPEAITKGNEEVARCKKIADALEFVQENFVFFTDFYQELLQELEYSVHFVRNAGYMQNMYFFNNSDEKLSPYYLPNRHILCLQACDKLSRLLCEIAKRKYFNDSEIEIIEKDVERVKKYRFRFVEPLKKTLAA